MRRVRKCASWALADLACRHRTGSQPHGASPVGGAPPVLIYTRAPLENLTRDRRAGSAGWNFSNKGGSRPATALSQPSLAWGLDIQDSLFHLVRHGDLGIISVIIKNEHRIPFGGNL